MPPVESLIDNDLGATHLADYSYLGLGAFVEVDYTEPDVKYTLVGTAGGNDPDTGDIYRGLDRFGRIKDSYWYNYGSSSDADRIKYGYDRNGNRLWRENTVAAAERQFVWGQRYIDDMVLRDRDTDGNGTLDERLYGMQDANWNVTGLVSTSGAVQERYAYSAYGKPMFLDASFGSRSSFSFAWERRFAGYVWDADVAWYAVRNRVYVVGLGWVQRDPEGISQDVNLVSYAMGRPINLIDPSGAITVGVIIGFWVIVGVFMIVTVVGAWIYKVVTCESGPITCSRAGLGSPIFLCVGHDGRNFVVEIPELRGQQCILFTIICAEDYPPPQAIPGRYDRLVKRGWK